MLNNQDLKPKRHYSQNFLRDDAVIENIVSCINPQKVDSILEVGGGEGVLSSKIGPHCLELVVLDIDPRMVTHLQEKFKLQDNISIVLQDALTYDYQSYCNSYRVVGNLPYHISTALITKFIYNYSSIIDLHLMVQKEVAQRLVASLGKKRSWQSVMIEYLYESEILFDVQASSFYPEPKVTSSVIYFKPKLDKASFDSKEVSLLEKTTKMAFNNKRKTLKNNFKNNLCTQDWQALNIDNQLRAEQLPLNDFILLNKYISNINKIS